MLDSLGLSILQNPDGTYGGAWGPFTVRSGFQPIFRMKDGKASLAAFEALARPFRNGVPSSPGKFFPLVPKDEALEVESLTRSIHMLNAGEILNKHEWLFVNFDPSMFPEAQDVREAMRMIATILDHTGMTRDQIVCEVTEHRLDNNRLLKLVQAMRDEGYKVAVDDYGAEDSDMARIEALKPDIVKFDAALITRWMNTDAGIDLLSEMVATFKSWNILTLFEGLEEGWQLDLAVKCKVDFVQGYVLARPVTVPANFSVFREGRGGRRSPERAPDDMDRTAYEMMRKLEKQKQATLVPDETDISKLTAVPPVQNSATVEMPRVPVKSFGGKKPIAFGRRQG